MISALRDKILCKMTALMCRSTGMARMGKNAKDINDKIVALNNVYNSVNGTWNLDMLNKTDCWVDKL